jgi:hypothetical protein
MFNLTRRPKQHLVPTLRLDMCYLKPQLWILIIQQFGVVQKFYTFTWEMPRSEIDRSSGWSWIVTGQKWIRLIKIRVDIQL